MARWKVIRDRQMDVIESAAESWFEYAQSKVHRKPWPFLWFAFVIGVIFGALA